MTDSPEAQDQVTLTGDTATLGGPTSTARVDMSFGDDVRAKKTKRLTADLPEKDAATLADVANRTGFNKVTTLIRAIRVLAELVRAEDRGGELTINYPDGGRERLILR